MSHDRAPIGPTKNAALRNGSRGRLFVGLAAITLIRAGEALAADQPATLAAPAGRNDLRPLLPGQPYELHSTSSTPGALKAEAMLNAAPEFSDTRYGKWDLSPSWPVRSESSAVTDMDSWAEFRPRPRSIFAPEPRSTSFDDHLEFDKTVWQRLQEYRTRDRVRVLTLWESAASAVSLQTDRKGGPSLQWTSRWMNRGGATRGLLDHWMPSSMFHFSRSPPQHVQTPIPPASQVHPGISVIP